MNDKAKKEDERNKDLPRLPIYDFKDGQFVVRKDSEEKDCFICLAPQQDNEWQRNFKSFFDPNNSVAARGADSPYLGYHNPLYYFFVSKNLDLEAFRAEKIYRSQINTGKSSTQAWKGADVHLYDKIDLGKTDHMGTQRRNDSTNSFMQLLALYKPYLCDDKHLSTIISAALRFYKDGWRRDNSQVNTLRKCNDFTGEDNKKQYINLKYVAHLLAVAMEARRLPDTPEGSLKGYDEIQPIKLEDDLLYRVSEAIKTKMEEVLNSEENKNKLTFRQIGEKFKKIREHENTIKTKQQKYKERLLEILKYGKENYSNGNAKLSPEMKENFRKMRGTDNFIDKIEKYSPEKIIGKLTDDKFNFYYIGSKFNVYNDLLTEEQQNELNNLEKEINETKTEKDELYKEIGSEKFHSQLKELDEIRVHMDFFCKHSKCDLGVLEQILNVICSIFGYKPFKGKNHMEFKKNPFDLINETISSEEKTKMSKPDQNKNITLT